MIFDPPVRPGDVVQMKKLHACGTDRWVVLYAGADMRIKCCGCGRVVLLDRQRFNSRLKRRLAISKEPGDFGAGLEII